MKVCLKLFHFRYRHVPGKYIDQEFYVVADDESIARNVLSEQAPVSDEWQIADFAQLTGFERPPTRLIGTWPQTIYPDAGDWVRLQRMILDRTSLRAEGLISMVKEWLGVKE